MATMARKPGITILPALLFMTAGLGLLMVATLLWFLALCGLLAVVGLRMSLPRRQPRVVRVRPGRV
jgi:hypothetical protein